MKCHNHQEYDAQGMCTQCGKPYCNNCLIDVGGKLKCRECLSKVSVQPENVQPTIVIQNSNANTNTNVVKNNSNDGWTGLGVCCCLIILFSMIGGAS